MVVEVTGNIFAHGGALQEMESKKIAVVEAERGE